MSQTHKVLGQSCPSGTSNTDLYTVPSATQAIVSSITVANISSSSASFRIAVRPSGAAAANQHWIAYDVPCPATDSITMTIGVSISAADVITVRSSTGNALAFSAFGVEIT